MSLLTLHDGTRLRVMGAKELITIPVWQGNRIMDISHVQKIKSEIGKDVQKLDFGYRIVTYDEIDAGGNCIKTSWIIDGQHRHRVIYDHFHETLCEPDFNVVVLEKHVKSESEIITSFKELNNQKPIPWKSDPNMLANGYIAELSAAFNTKKEQLIRAKSTTRPYLSAEKLREVLVQHGDLLSESADDIKAFVERAKIYNLKAIQAVEMLILGAKKGQEIMERAAKHRFMLAVEPKLPWVVMCLRG
jgi:hypothetical protein